MTAVQLSEEDCRNVTWRLVEQTDDYRRYVGSGTHPVSGQPITVQKTEYLAEEALLRRNAEECNDADGKRWTQGAGSDRNGVPLVRVGRVSLNKLFADFRGRFDDQDFAKWWLERDENQPFRTRRGNL